MSGWTRAFQNPYTMAGRVPSVDTIIRDDTRVLSRIPAQLWSAPRRAYFGGSELEGGIGAEGLGPVPSNKKNAEAQVPSSVDTQGVGNASSSLWCQHR